MSDLQPVLNVKMAAEYLNLSVVTVKRRIKSGLLKAYKDGGYWKIKREWILEYQDQLRRNQI